MQRELQDAFQMLRTHLPRRFHLALLFALALAVRFVIFALSYSPELSAFESGDYALYRIGADHISTVGDFSNSLFLVRPFLYPLIVWLLGNQSLLVLLVDIVVGSLLAPLTFLLAARLSMSVRVSLLAGVIAALDLGSILTSAFLGPEPFANMLLALVFLGALALANESTTPRQILVGIAVGALLALSSLVRPAAYLLWVPLGFWLVFGRRYAAALVLSAACVIGIGGWIFHNGVVFGYPTFSTVSAYTMVYYRAVAVERLAINSDPDDVILSVNRRMEALLGRDPDAATMASMHGYLAATPAVTDALQQVAFDIFRAYPLEYLLTLPVGFARMYGLVPNQGSFSGTLGWVEAGWNVFFTASAALGLFFLLSERRWRAFWFVLLVAAYFTVGTLAVKSAGMTTRERTMLTPLMATMSAYAVNGVVERRRRAVGRDGVLSGATMDTG